MHFVIGRPIDQDHTFEGIVEGVGSSFTYYVITAHAQSDACL